MSVNIMTTRTVDLPLPTVEQIRDRLTRAGSQTQLDFGCISRAMLGSIPADLMPDYHLSVCMRDDPYTDLSHCVGWASVTEWDRSAALQVCVDEQYRSMGLGTALISSLVVDGILCRDNPVAVFSDECVRIAQRLRFTTIHRYRQTDDGWIRSEVIDNVRGRSEPERLCDAPSSVRDLPLAAGAEGQDS